MTLKMMNEGCLIEMVLDPDVNWTRAWLASPTSPSWKVTPGLLPCLRGREGGERERGEKLWWGGEGGERGGEREGEGRRSRGEGGERERGGRGRGIGRGGGRGEGGRGGGRGEGGRGREEGEGVR